MLSFIVLTEAFASKECENTGMHVESKRDRDEAKSTLYTRKTTCHVGKTYHTISRIRNAIAHQGKKDISIDKEIDNLSTYVKIAQTFINQEVK